MESEVNNPVKFVVMAIAGAAVTGLGHDLGIATIGVAGAMTAVIGIMGAFVSGMKWLDQ